MSTRVLICSKGYDATCSRGLDMTTQLVMMTVTMTGCCDWQPPYS